MTSGSSPSGFSPSQIQSAYGFNQIQFGSVKGDGTGQTIAIVDAQDDPNIQSDLNAFDSQFGLPDHDGRTGQRDRRDELSRRPIRRAAGRWRSRSTSSGLTPIAPGASIMLVEASSASDSDLLTAVNYAADHANVVSMSWGGERVLGRDGIELRRQPSSMRAWRLWPPRATTGRRSRGRPPRPMSWPSAARR